MTDQAPAAMASSAHHREPPAPTRRGPKALGTDPSEPRSLTLEFDSIRDAATPFAARIVAWQRAAGRHDLPWQQTRDAYRIWLSEIMLQQTQVATVLPYYARFLARFPDVRALAEADVDEVLALWSGLGYYRRAHRLHRAAREVVGAHGGILPDDAATLAALPGIGRSSANAIAAFAFGSAAPILEGNVKRVLARHRGVEGWPGDPAVTKRLWQHAEALMPHLDVEAYTQGMMDLGATLCTPRAPGCARCPVQEDCVALHSGRADEIPASRPRRTLPQRRALALLIEHDSGDGRILLLRRPAHGVWAGLLSLPELACADDDPADRPGAEARLRGHARDALGIDVVDGRWLPDVVHAFTHFALTLKPYRARAANVAAALHDAPARWLLPQAAVDSGVPAPIRKLLVEHFGARNRP